MKKTTFFTLVFLILSVLFSTLYAQQIKSPTWDSLNGGINVDCFTAIQQTAEGAVFFAGYSNSNIYNHHGSMDGWMVKRNINGLILWQYHYGTNNAETLNKFTILPNGDIVAVGTVSAFFGPLPIDFHGMSDLFVVKINGYNGHVIWQKCIGGIDDDVCLDIIFDSVTNCCVLAGKTRSFDGDFLNSTGGYGDYDAFLMKIDTSGNILPASKFGGSGYDCFHSLVKNQDGNIIAVGETNSIDFDAISIHPGILSQTSDIFVINVDSSMALSWVACIGTSASENASSVVMLPDNSILVGGRSTNPSDGIIVRMSEYDGSVLWFNYYGGSVQEYEINLKVNTYTGDIFAFGVTDSNIPAVMGGDCNSWIFVVDSVSGSITDTLLINGIDHESIFDILPLAENHFIAVGEKCPTSFVPTWDGFIIGTHENFQPPISLITFNYKQEVISCVTLYPNPLGDELLTIFSDEKIFNMRIFSLDGKILFEKNELPKENKLTVDLSDIPKGFYLVNINNTQNISLIKR